MVPANNTPKAFLANLKEETRQLRNNGLYKEEYPITSPQQAVITLADGQEVINFCANNYLGLANHSDLIEAAKAGGDQHGFGMASVRFICGTQDVHKTLEARISSFLGTEDTILYSSCFDANGGLFEAILGPEDAVISDELNHASIIDGIRLCKATRYRYKNNDMRDLEQQLHAAEMKGARFKLIATDGVFSMDGIVADLKGICDLAERYRALVMVDDSHAVGFMGKNGRGTPEFCGVEDRVDIITGTLGKALGGASGGYTSGRKEIISWLRQRSRPYLFSNTLAPMIAAASLKVLDMLEKSDDLRVKLEENSQLFRAEMMNLGFELVPGHHPIIPVMLGDAKLATRVSEQMMQEGIYVIGFSYPVVPRGKARIRTQMSAAHDKVHLEKAVAAFGKVGRELGIIDRALP
jgi:glycine C-acetyltransferase